MNVIFPEMNFLSGEKGTGARLSKGDPQKFMKILVEAANQLAPNTQGEPTAVFEEMVNILGWPVSIESEMCIVCSVEAEVMDDNVSLEENEALLYMGNLGISMVVQPPVEITDHGSEDVTSVVASLEMSEPETMSGSSTLATEITTDPENFSGKVAQTKAEPWETDAVRIGLPNEEERGTVKGKGRERSIELSFGEKQTVVQNEFLKKVPSVTKIIEAHGGKSGPTQDELKENALPQEQSTTGVYTGTQLFVGPENEFKGTVAATGLAAKVMGPIIKEMQLQHTLKDGVGEILVRLQPDSLGKVLIKISRADGRLSGRILVENFTVKEVLESHLPLLRERLNDLGIELKQMHVSLGSSSDKEGGAGLPERKSWSVTGLRGKGLNHMVSESHVQAMQGVLDILV